MPNYFNGKIYKIVNDNLSICYIGSTVQPLSVRMSAHQGRHKSGSFARYKKWGKIEDCKIHLIENYPCKDKHELESRERHFIESYRAGTGSAPRNEKAGKDKESAASEANAAGGDEDGAPLDDSMLLPGATARDQQHRRSSRAERSSTELAINLASSPAVRAQSGESLGKIQSAAVRWRQAMTKVVAVGWFAAEGVEGGSGGGGASKGGESARTAGERGEYATNRVAA
eukprot:gene11501-31945_t